MEFCDFEMAQPWLIQDYFTRCDFPLLSHIHLVFYAVINGYFNALSSSESSGANSPFKG